MEALTLNPLKSCSGEVTIPGSKSLSNRVLLLAALAEGTTAVTNLLESDDVRHMVTALRALGVSVGVDPADPTRCTVDGLGGPIAASDQALHLGNAGTAMRPLAAALCAGEGGRFVLDGEPRMRERPIGHLVDALRPLGASIAYQMDEGYPPLAIEPCGLDGGLVSIDGRISSQFLTALLMTALMARGPLAIEVEGDLVSKPYIDITLDLMGRFGVEVEAANYQRFQVNAPATYRTPGSVLVEGDASSASYFLAAAAIAGGTLRVHGVGTSSTQGDVAFIDVLEQMGATIAKGPEWLEVTRGSLRGIDVDLNHIPDAAMTIATTALFADGPTVIRNVYNWRVKETDRLAAMATELRKVGAVVEEGHDYIAIEPPETIQAAAIDTYDDHRMAMCFALAAFGDAPITINDPGCTAKTFPDFFDRFASVTC